MNESVIGAGGCVSTFRDGNIFTEHLPICMTSTITASVSHTDKLTQPRVDWGKASSTDIENYKTLIDAHLRHIDLSEAITSCNDCSCTSHDELIMNSLENITKILRKCANIAIPRQRVSGKPGIPGWNEFVKPYKDKSIFWNDVWKNAGSPDSGQLADIRRISRSKYHWAIKEIKRNADELIKEKTAFTLSHKSFGQQ